MKKVIILGWVILFLAATAFAQESVEAPIWKVGDRWIFERGGQMEVIGNDAQSFSVKFSEGLFPLGTSGIAIFERSTLNVKYLLDGDRRKEYAGFGKKILNFPLNPTKQWKELHQRDEIGGFGRVAAEYHESLRVLGWEEVEVPAGKFKAIKLEYKIEPFQRIGIGWVPMGESTAWYWYSPEVKNFVKCRYDKGYHEEAGGRKDWELVSYELKK